MDPQAVTETTFHRAMEIITVFGIPGILATMGKIIWSAAQLQTTVINIRDNHLVHIAKDIAETKTDLAKGIDETKKDLKELRGQFVDHIAARVD